MTEIVPTIVKTRGATQTRTSVKASPPKRRIGLTVVLGAVALLWMVPLIGLLITAFRDTTAATQSGWWIALVDPTQARWTFANFGDALSGAGTGTGQSLSASFLNTVAITIPATILPLMFAAFAAYAFTFLEFKFREAYFAIIVGLLVVPVQIALIPVLQTYTTITKATGIPIVGTPVATWIVHSAFAMPLCIFTLRNYMSTLPNALIEAARVDGASHFVIFWRLVVPMSVPALAAFAIFQFLWVWNDYLVGFIFSGTGSPTLQVALLALLGQFGSGWNLVAAGSFIVMLIPVIVFLAMQRFFVRGLTAGSVK